MAGIAWAIAAAAAHGPALRLAVGAIAAAVVVGRLAIGAEMRAGRGAVAWLALGACRVLVVVPAVALDSDVRLVAVLASLSTIPFVAGAAPAAGSTHAARAMVTSALAAALGVVVAIAVTPSTVDVRLDSLVPYAAAAGALLGLAETLAHHRARRGFSITVATIGAVAASVGVASTTGVSQAPGDIGTSAALAAAATLAAGL